MPTLRYKGGYGTSKSLTTERWADLQPEDRVPSEKVVTLSAYAHLYLSTTARPYTYNYTVSVYGGARPSDYATVEATIINYGISPNQQNIAYLMEKLLQRGNVNLLTRPQVPAEDLEAAGWEDAGEGTATVFSTAYSAGSDGIEFPVDVILHMTPIVADGSVLSPAQLDAYVDGLLSHGSIHAAIESDKTANGGSGLILWAQRVSGGWTAGWEAADTYDEILHTMQAGYYLHDYTVLPGSLELLNILPDYQTPVVYSGSSSYNFASVDTPVYVDVPITINSPDYSYPIKTIYEMTIVETGGHGSTTRVRGTVRLYCEYGYIGQPTAATNIRINNATAINLEASHTATLTWSPASIGSYDTLSFYRVARYEPATETWTTETTTNSLSYTITAPYTDSKSYYYYIETVTANYRAMSATYASIYTYIQLTAPTVTGLGDFPIRNPRPMLLVQLGNGPIDEYLTLLADGWTASRKGFPGDKIYLRRNSAYTANTTESVSMTETDERMRSVTSSASVSYAAPVYTDPEIIAGTSIVKAADISEMQTQLAMIRENYGMDEYWFTACLPQVTSLTLWSTHISEIQDCIREIQSFVNSWDLSSPTWAIILPTMLTTTGPSAAVIRQLRQIITML